MNAAISRRHWLAGLAAGVASAARPKGTLVDSHIHLFDPTRFPYHRNATYRPAARTLESYVAFARQAEITHAVIVHPEPYQDDHRYLEFCFAHEPSPGFFKGTCLFDPVSTDTPARMAALAKRNPGRIVALRIHATYIPGTQPASPAAIRDRDLRTPAILDTWRAAGRLGMAIQMHLIPRYAGQVASLIAQAPETPVIIDHLARPAQGKGHEYNDVLELKHFPHVYMKYSAVNYASREGYPYKDARSIVRQCYEAFGPDRMIWGGLGMNMGEFEKQCALFDTMFDFVPEADRRKIRGENAMALFRFKA